MSFEGIAVWAFRVFSDASMCALVQERATVGTDRALEFFFAEIPHLEDEEIDPPLESVMPHTILLTLLITLSWILCMRFDWAV